MKHRMYLSKSSSKTYKYIESNYVHALGIHDNYQLILVTDYLLTLMWAIELVVYVNKHLSPTDSIYKDHEREINEALDFIKAYSSFDESDLDDALVKVSEMVDTIQYTENNHFGYREALTDYIMLKTIEDYTVYAHVDDMVTSLHRYCFDNTKPDTAVTKHDIEELYSNYVRDYIECKIPSTDPTTAENLLAVFLIKYPNLLDDSTQLPLFGIFKGKYKTIGNIVNREFKTHVYNETGSGFNFSEATLK